MDIPEVPALVFSNMPDLKDLVCVVVSINPKEIKHSSAKSDFQWQLFKTRSLVLGNNQVIASPVMSNLTLIFVVCYKQYYLHGCLALNLRELNLQVEVVSSLSLPVYKDCLVYNIICKLAPEWNRIENYFIHGKYFLMRNNPLKTVELHLSISGDQLHIFCNPTRLWLSELRLSDFDVPQSVIRDKKSPFFVDLSANPVWAHVLPSFKRGRIVFVTNQVPPDSPFCNYDDMRRNWQNIYGFRLPNKDSGIIYVGVNFYGANNYLYPLPCVRKGLHHNEGDPSWVNLFAELFLAKSSSIICGVQLCLVKMPQLPADNPALSEKEPQKWNEKDLLQMERRLIYNFINPPNEDTTSSTQNYNHKPEDDWFVKCSSFIDGLSQINNKSCRSRKGPNPSNIRQPVFANKPRRRTLDSVIRRPIFIETSPENIRIKQEPENTSVSDSSAPVQNDTQIMAPYKPTFSVKKSVVNERAIRSVFSRVEQKVPSAKSKPVEAKQPPQTPLFMTHLVKKQTLPLLPDKNMNTIPPKEPPRKLKKCRSSAISKDKKNQEPRKNICENTVEVSETWQPVILSDQEVEAFARHKKLNKVNAPSLYSYLTRKGVACKKREKKNDLLLKGEFFFNQNHLSPQIVNEPNGIKTESPPSPEVKVKVEPVEFEWEDF